MKRRDGRLLDRGIGGEDRWLRGWERDVHFIVEKDLGRSTPALTDSLERRPSSRCRWRGMEYDVVPGWVVKV